MRSCDPTVGGRLHPGAERGRPQDFSGGQRLRWDKSELTIVVVEHPSLATVLKTAFGAYWDRSLTFEGAARRVPAAARA